MQDLQREILSQVATGTISAEEGVARLQSLEEADARAPAEAPTATAPSAAARLEERRIKVVSLAGSTEIVGDPSVAYVIADGPHSARYEGDTMVISHAPFEEADHFTFGHGNRRMVVDGIDFHRRKLTVRMNPKLALFATIQAGSVRIEGVQGPIEGEIQAANCQVSGFRGPLSFVIQMGNLSASGRLDSGVSNIRCEMGSVKIHLEKESSVRVTAHATLGRVSIDREGADTVTPGQTGTDVCFGSGDGSLDVTCTMGNVRVSGD